jgi:hypothetical protein
MSLRINEVGRAESCKAGRAIAPKVVSREVLGAKAHRLLPDAIPPVALGVEGRLGWLR